MEPIVSYFYFLLVLPETGCGSASMWADDGEGREICGRGGRGAQETVEGGPGWGKVIGWDG